MIPGERAGAGSPEWRSECLLAASKAGFNSPRFRAPAPIQPFCALRRCCKERPLRLCQDNSRSRVLGKLLEATVNASQQLLTGTGIATCKALLQQVPVPVDSLRKPYVLTQPLGQESWHPLPPVSACPLSRLLLRLARSFLGLLRLFEPFQLILELPFLPRPEHLNAAGLGFRV